MTYSIGPRAIGVLCICGLAACTEAPAGSSAAGAAGLAGAAGSVSAVAGSSGQTAGGAAGAASGGQAGDTAAGSSGVAGSGGGTGGAQGGSAGAAVVDPNAPDPSTGCGSADALADGEHELQVGDLTRPYVLRKPSNYDATKPWPLLLALHPNGSSRSYWDATSGERAFRPLLAEAALLVLPQARPTDPPDGDNGDWRGDVPLDLSYFDALITQLDASLCFDKKRIYAAGFSGGGSFAGALGCYRTDIRAIAVGGAVTYFEEQDCVGKPGAWITIGDEEAIQGRLDFRDFWRTSAGCEATGATAEPSTCLAYECPDPERPVQFCSHPGGHVWPSFGTSAAWSFVSQL